MLQNTAIPLLLRSKKTFKHGLGESTVRLFKKKYLEELKRAKEKTSRRSFRSEKDCCQGSWQASFAWRVWQWYTGDIKAYRKAGTHVNVPVVLTAAERVIIAKNRSLLLKYGGHTELNRPWAVSILQWIGFVQRRGSTQTKVSDQQIIRTKYTYLSQISEMVKAHKIPPE